MVRNSVFDNTKFLLIVLVVFGHLIEPLIDQAVVIKTVYLSIYSFHMPLFVMLSGMLTRPDYSKEGLEKISSLLIPFFVFTFLYEFFNVLFYGTLSTYTVNLQPYWILWFLYSLFLWRIFLPIALKFRYSIGISFVLALAAGYSESVGYVMGLGRTLYFFPFFLIGNRLTSSLLWNELLLSISKKIYALLIVLNVALFWIFHEIPEECLYGSFSYTDQGIGSWFAPALRMLMYTVSVVTSISILMLMPNAETKVSKIGSRSLHIYLWHGFFVKILIGLGVISFVGDLMSPLTILAVLGLSLGLTLALSSKLFSKMTHFFLDKAESLILKKISRHSPGN